MSCTTGLYNDGANYSTPNKIWNTALYMRLSREDGDKVESDSIANQREILNYYVSKFPEFNVFDTYIDDGFTGTNFNRPDFNRMLADIYLGKIDCIIVKDLSRFGREYSECSRFIEKEFAYRGIRFVAIIDNFDNSKKCRALENVTKVGFTGVFNETVSARTSDSVRETLNYKRDAGQFIGSFATYGYLKNPNDKNRLIVDPDAAPIVKMIFKKFLNGESIIGIAKDLNEAGIPNPSLYKKMKGMKYNHSSGEKNDGLWPDSTVRRILQNQMYVGDMVQGKNEKISYKIQKCRAVAKENWKIVANTHEPIIERELFDEVQKLFNKNIRKSPNKKEVDLFSGFVKCADCGRAMNKKTNTHSYGNYEYYRCVTKRKMKNSACTNHTIRIDKLEEAVFVTIKNLINVATDFEEIIKRIQTSEGARNEVSHFKKTLEGYIKEKEKLQTRILSLYPDLKEGIITKEQYFTLKNDIDERECMLNEKIALIEKSIKEFHGENVDKNEFIVHFKKYGNIQKLTRSVVVELIDKILVYEGGNIEVIFNFKDAYLQTLEYIEINKQLIESEKSTKKKKTA